MTLTREDITNAIIPILCFVIYGALYSLLASLSRLVVFYSENIFIIITLVILSNIVAFVTCYRLYVYLKNNFNQPLKAFGLGALALVFVVGINLLFVTFLGGFAASQIPENPIIVEKYFEYSNYQKIIWFISNSFLLILIGVKLFTAKDTEN